MYLLDANTYIQAKNFHYQMSFCPAYWSWLDQQSAANVASIQFVYDELMDGDDELSTWVKERKTHFISISDDACQDKFAEIAQYVTELDGKNPENVADFLARADPWLVAKAAVTGATVVTHESRVPANSTKVKIPNICDEFGVPYISTYQLLRVLEAQFILA